MSADVGVGTTTALLDGLRAQVTEGTVEGPDALVEALKADVEARLEGDRTLRRSDDGTDGLALRRASTASARRRPSASWPSGRSRTAGVSCSPPATRSGPRPASSSACGPSGPAPTSSRARPGGDPSSVIFDAVQRAAARGADLVLADTAGRIHTKSNLMEELRKVRRVADRDPGDVTEVLLVLDATTGQNGLAQARQFTEAVDVTGVVLTKLDGSARGGIVIAIQDELGIPVKLVGLGEKAEDLIEFDPHDFVEALFDGAEA